MSYILRWYRYKLYMLISASFLRHGAALSRVFLRYIATDRLLLIFRFQSSHRNFFVNSIKSHWFVINSCRSKKFIIINTNR